MNNLIANGLQLGTSFSLNQFIIALALTTILSYLLSLFYVKFGSSISNRRSFSGNFIIIALTTMLVISVVKSSLALSLGLVGALSIIRFRTAIKDPEELAFLFITIAIGLGMGAGQFKITVVAFIFIVGVLALKQKLLGGEDSQNLFLTISQSDGSENAKLESILDVLKKQNSKVELRRYEENGNDFEVSFSISFKNLKQFENVKSELRQVCPRLNITFLDPSGVPY